MDCISTKLHMVSWARHTHTLDRKTIILLLTEQRRTFFADTALDGWFSRTLDLGTSKSFTMSYIIRCKMKLCLPALLIILLLSRLWWSSPTFVLLFY